MKTVRFQRAARFSRRRVWRRCLLLLLLPALFVVFSSGPLAGRAAAEDLVEFLSGAKARGTVKQIRKADTEFDFEVRIGGRSLVRTYAFEKVHAVTINGQRYVLNPLGTASEEEAGDESRPRRTEAEVLALIDSTGRTPPDWFASTPLDYPPTLDLDWPLQPPDKGWNNQKNVGQYKWDVINPNPNRWKPGIRLLHEIMARHKDSPELLRRDMRAVAEMYFELLQDYARAAFWLRQARVELPEPQAVHLAECYWHLGNEAMALKMLSAQRLPMNAIKLLGDLGKTDRAVQLAESFARSNPDRAHEPYLLAGDACRQAGRYTDAVKLYEKVLELGQARNQEYQRIYTGRARDSIAAVQLFDRVEVGKVADGTYLASSTGYNGPVEVEVRVAGGRIEAVRVTQHQEKQFYAALTDTPDKILKKQSIKQIDATSRATITSQAIVNATAQALSKGTR